MGIRDRLKRLERAAGEDTVLARCLECGEEKRIRAGIFLDLVALGWQMRQDGSDQLPDATPSDIRWVHEHPCDALHLRDKQSGESVFGEVWERGALAMRGADEE
jgi:hypothetical protein